MPHMRRIHHSTSLPEVVLKEHVQTGTAFDSSEETWKNERENQIRSKLRTSSSYFTSVPNF